MKIYKIKDSTSLFDLVSKVWHLYLRKNFSLRVCIFQDLRYARLLARLIIVWINWWTKLVRLYLQKAYILSEWDHLLIQIENIYIRLKYMVLYIKPNPWAFLVSHSLLPTTPLQNHSAHPAALLWAPGAELVSFSFVPSFFCTSLGHQHDQNSFWSITIFYYWCLLSYFLILRL